MLLAPGLVRNRDRLVAALQARGIRYLAPRDAQGEPMDDAALLASLAAAHTDARLRQALIAYFLLYPERAVLVQAVKHTLAPAAENELIALYMAAVYLQQIWWVQLARHLPPFQPLPDDFSQSLQLPPPQDGYGEMGLSALAAWHAHHTRDRANHLSEYEGVASLLLEQLKLQARRHDAAFAR